MTETPNPTRHATILARFATRDALDAALSHLEGEAIPRAQIEVRSAAAPSEPPSDEPLREDEERNLRTMRTSMAAAGAGMAAAGVVIATGGAALPAVAAAVAAGAGAGAVSEGAARALGTAGEAQSQHAGHVVAVAPANTDQAVRAKSILGRSGAEQVWEE